jgi:hypothetical protein
MRDHGTSRVGSLLFADEPRPRPVIDGRRISAQPSIR